MGRMEHLGNQGLFHVVKVFTGSVRPSKAEAAIERAFGSGQRLLWVRYVESLALVTTDFRALSGSKPISVLRNQFVELIV